MSNDASGRPEVLEAVLRRAAVEPAFRQQLLTDPTAAVHAAAPGAVPFGVRLRFIERPADLDALYVLPDPVTSAAELSAQELEAVAGGADAAVGDGGGCPWTCIDLVTCIYDTVSA